MAGQNNNPEFNAKHPRKGGKFTKKGTGTGAGTGKRIINGLGVDVTDLLKTGDIKGNLRAMESAAKKAAAAKKRAGKKKASAKKAAGRKAATAKKAAARKRATAAKRAISTRASAVNSLAANQRAAYRAKNKAPSGYVWNANNKLVKASTAAARMSVARGLPAATAAKPKKRTPSKPSTAKRTTSTTAPKKLRSTKAKSTTHGLAFGGVVSSRRKTGRARRR